MTKPKPGAKRGAPKKPKSKLKAGRIALRCTAADELRLERLAKLYGYSEGEIVCFALALCEACGPLHPSPSTAKNKLVD